MPPIPMPCVPKSEQGGFWVRKVSQQSPYGTCYAHSAANAVIEACTRRVRFLRSRRNQHHSKLFYVIPNHEELVEEMIENARKCGNKTPCYGGQLDRALLYGAKKYKLTVKRIGQAQAKRIVQKEERPVPATFFITQRQWAEYEQFFDTYKGDRSDWVMMNWNLPGLAKPPPSKYKPWQKTGHAILLVAAGQGKDNQGQKCSHQVKEYWVFKNSWGNAHGHGGYDRVAFDAVHWSEFYDVRYQVDTGYVQPGWSRKAAFLDVGVLSQGKVPKRDKENPQWYMTKGVNYSGKCVNESCAQHGKKVMCRRGFGEIDAVQDKYKQRIACPDCGSDFVCTGVYLFDCHCEIEYMMITGGADGVNMTHSPRENEYVLLGQDSGVMLRQWYCSLEFVCSKH